MMTLCCRPGVCGTRRGRWCRTSFRTGCVVAACLLSATSEGLAQDVTLIPRMRAGDQFRLEVTRSRENSSRPGQDGRSRTAVDVEVLSASPEGFVLEWAPGEAVFENPQVAADPLLAVTSDALRDMRFHVTLSADGEFTGVANEADVMPRLQASLDIVVRELAGRLPDAQRKPFEDAMARLLSPQTLMASATRDAQIYFGLNGVALAVDEAVELAIEQPNPLGEGVIPTTFRVHMVSATADTASLTTTTAYEAAALARMTAALAQQAGAPIAPDALAQIPPIEMADDGRYLFDRTVGLMREVVVGRRIEAGTNRRVDGWEIRLLSGPSR